MDLLINSHGLSWIALKIFKLLGKEDLYNCRKVCKHWKTVIDSDLFWFRLHIENVYKVVQRMVVHSKYMYLPNHPNAKGESTSILEIFPDLNLIFTSALNQNMEEFFNRYF